MPKGKKGQKRRMTKSEKIEGQEKLKIERKITKNKKSEHEKRNTKLEEREKIS